jgi:hypothetical protein
MTFSSYPYNTSQTMDAARERWVSTNTRELPLQDTNTPLDPTAEWALMLHNHLSQEDGGCLLVLDSARVAALAVAGTYAVQPKLTPQPGTRSLRVAVGYWSGRHWQDELPVFRQEAGAVRERLTALQFNLTANRIWDSAVARDDYEYLLAQEWLPADLREQARQAWSALEQARGAGDEPLSHEGELSFLQATRQCQDLHHRMQVAWLQSIGRMMEETR